METLTWLIDFVLHVDKHLDQLLQTYGAWTYAILFGIIFLETGVVFTPFLPGDSLLFAAGMFAARGSLDPHMLFVLLSVAAILGDSTNFAVGRFIGPRLMRGPARRFLKQEYLDLTHSYFEKYGGATIILGRFVPIVRTFAPFVAGIGSMNYGKFLAYNVIGGLIWVAICSYGGFFLGNVPAIRDNFELTVLLIIFISILPGIIGFARARLAARRAAASADAP
jgi:membrane-associated protein